MGETRGWLLGMNERAFYVIEHLNPVMFFCLIHIRASCEYQTKLTRDLVQGGVGNATWFIISSFTELRPRIQSEVKRKGITALGAENRVWVTLGKNTRTISAMLVGKPAAVLLSKCDTEETDDD